MNAKRILVQLCLLGMVFLPATVRAQFTFTTNADNTLTLTGYTGSDGEVVIPDTTNGYPVTAIGDNAFAYDYNLTSITVPTSITSIGIVAFYGCIKLAGITIPDNVTNIGAAAFNSCFSLTNVTIPASVTSIGDYAFFYCNNLTAITVNATNLFYSSADGVLFNKDKTILKQFPFGKSGSYSIPSSVTSLADEAFGIRVFGNTVFYTPTCAGLTNLIIPNSITNIPDYAFAQCIGLTSVSIGSGLSSIGIQAFFACENLVSVRIPGSITNLGSEAFEGCTSLASITLEYGLVSIGDQAFNSCGELPRIVIPASVTNIGMNAFFQCFNLHLIFFLGNAPGVGNDTSVFDGTWDATAYYLPGKTGWESSFDGLPTIEELFPSVYAYTITNGAINITGYIGSNDTLVVPKRIGGLTVRSIGNVAFFGYSNLKSVTISEGVTHIETEAFDFCNNLTSINVAAGNSVFSSIKGGSHLI